MKKQHGFAAAAFFASLAGLTPFASAQAPIHSWDSNQIQANEVGRTVLSLGDVNGDGKPDFVISSSNNVMNSIHVVSGADGSELFEFTGDPALSEHFYWPTADAGDVNGDGIHDIVVGTIGAYQSQYQFAARVFSGKDGSPLLTCLDSSALHLGASVGGAGDVDGDGFDDIIAGAPMGGAPSSALVFSGRTGTVLHKVFGPQLNDFFGNSVSGAGDWNHDGHSDFLVGAFGTLDSSGAVAGAAYLYSGADGTILHAFRGGLGGQGGLGNRVGVAGDLDGDGFTDIFVAGFGSVTAYGRRGGKIEEILTARVQSPDSIVNVAGVGDVNGDGRDDLGVTTGNPASARIFSGKTGAEILHIENNFEKNEPAPFLGGVGMVSIAAAGDADGDGFDDILVGNPNWWYGSGKAVLYSGGSIRSYGEGCDAGGYFKPGLVISGKVGAGNGIEFRLSGIEPGTHGLLIAGLHPSQVPIGNGCFALVAGSTATIGISSATPELIFSIPAPGHLLQGSFFQTRFSNGSASNGVALKPW